MSAKGTSLLTPAEAQGIARSTFADLQAREQAARDLEFRLTEHGLYQDAESVDREQMAVYRAYYDQCQAQTTFTVRRDNYPVDCVFLPVEVADTLNRLLTAGKTLEITIRIAEVSK